MSFNLSLAKAEVEKDPSLVRAEPTLNETTNPQTGDKYQETSTSGGVEINKGQAPALVVTGPVGYQCTDLLNRILTKESMGALVAAYEDGKEFRRVDDVQHSGNPTGVTRVNTQTGQAVAETVPNPKSFLYVADGQSLTSRQVMDAINSVTQAKREDPAAEVAIAVVSTEGVTPTMESLVSFASKMGVRVAITPFGVNQLVTSMASRHTK